MSRYYGRWAPYVPVAARRKQAEREVAKLAKQGQTISPVIIAGKHIATTFWGQAWCDNLESYQDFENRLPRGRTYVRNGSVVDLQIASCEIRALVRGSSLYRVSVSIGALPRTQWRSTCHDCAGGIDSLVELLQGRFSKAVMARICQQGKGLFPKPSEIKFSCSCPDYASMCKHIAAVLYGVGARLDEQPDLLFQLRAVDQRELVANLDGALPLSKSQPDATKVLVADDISALFGLDMAEDDAPVVPSPKVLKKAKSIAPRAATAEAKKLAARVPSPAKASTASSKTTVGAKVVVPKIATKMWTIPSSPPSAAVRAVPGGSGTGKASALKSIDNSAPAGRRTSTAKTKAPVVATPSRSIRGRSAR